jgi:hypothetical protein
MRTDLMQPRMNRLIVAMLTTEKDRLLPHPRLAIVGLDQVLVEADEWVRQVLYPKVVIISLLRDVDEGSTTQAEPVGDEARGVDALANRSLRCTQRILRYSLGKRSMIAPNGLDAIPREWYRAVKRTFELALARA